MKNLFYAILSLCLFVSCATFAQESTANISDMPDSRVLSIENEFIKIILNNKDKDTGRFSIETILGDPQNPKDDNSPLIFGRPIPWTSYTTLLIDGTPHIFGGLNTKILKRGGQKTAFGTVVSQNISSDGLVTETFFPDAKIRVFQRLSFVRNPSTRVNDMALIHYNIVNEDMAPHEVGVRLMMDTKLGQNDGAPFRIGDKAVTSETRLTEADLVDYWLTFDSLSSPNVIAQGILKQTDMQVFPPDQLYLANWGTLVDSPWDFDYQEGRSFIRAGEAEKDTALALYWNPINIPPNTQRDTRTLYGLGGVTLQPGELSLGLTAPSEIHRSSKKEILIMAYVHNAGGFDSLNTQVFFTLPNGFVITQGDAKTTIGRLKAGQTRQIPIKVRLQDPLPGTVQLKVNVTSDTVEPNATRRNIDILGIPELTTKFTVSPYSEDPLNLYYDAKLQVSNPSQKAVEGLRVTLIPQEGIKIPAFEIATKTQPYVGANGTLLFDWKMKLSNNTNATASVVAIIQSDVTPTKRHLMTFSPKDFDENYYLYPSKPSLQTGDVFYVTLGVHHAKSGENHLLHLTYDPDVLEIIRWSPSPWLFATTPPSIKDGSFNLGPINWPSLSPELTICKVHFKVLKSGATSLSLKRFEAIKAQHIITIQEDSL